MKPVPWELGEKRRALLWRPRSEHGEYTLRVWRSDNWFSAGEGLTAWGAKDRIAACLWVWADGTFQLRSESAYRNRIRKTPWELQPGEAAAEEEKFIAIVEGLDDRLHDRLSSTALEDDWKARGPADGPHAWDRGFWKSEEWSDD